MSEPNVNDEWIKIQQANLKNIQKFKKTKDLDRLSLLQRWQVLHTILAESFKGWSHWIASAQVMEKVPLPTMEEMFLTYLDFVESYVSLDIQATKFLDKVVTAEEKADSKQKNCPSYAV